jgi:hypothetical protein
LHQKAKADLNSIGFCRCAVHDCSIAGQQPGDKNNADEVTDVDFEEVKQVCQR